MNESLYDSFRWLDDDGDLDLSLAEYPAPITNPLPSKRKPSFGRTLSLNSGHLRRPSFQRTLSSNSTNLARKSISFTHGRAPLSSGLPEKTSSLANVTSTGSSSSRPSSKGQFYHVPRSSTSSIDPSAQYYQDPEARLKLRVYLASPQKFDEALEYGFPALNNQEISMPKNGPPASRQGAQGFTGTFLEDDDASVLDENSELYPNISRLSYVLEDPQLPQNTTILDVKRQSEVPPSKSGPHQHQTSREMTLRMTLTRPDLRTDSPPTPSSVGDLSISTELPHMDQCSHSGKLDANGHGLVKKMWRKFCRRKY